MKIFNNASLLTDRQRKSLAMLLLALVFTNSQVPTARAAAPDASIEAPIITQAVVIELPAATSTDAIATTEVKLTVQDVLLSVCKSHGYGESCAKTLLGMLWNESSNVSTAIGDGGKARGYFQIHYRLHNISIECAEDLVCSADWTIKYMEAHSYPKYVNYAVQCHNSCGVNNGYAARAARHAKLLWDTPLEIKQATSITLAAN